MEIQKEWISTKELATLIGRSTKFIEKHRKRIVSGIKDGGQWSYHLPSIRLRLASGKGIIE